MSCSGLCQYVTIATEIKIHTPHHNDDEVPMKRYSVYLGELMSLSGRSPGHATPRVFLSHAGHVIVLIFVHVHCYSVFFLLLYYRVKFEEEKKTRWRTIYIDCYCTNIVTYIVRDRGGSRVL